MDPSRQIRAWVSGLIRRAKVPKVDDANPTQRVQLVTTSTDGAADHDAIEHIQPYGISFNPGTVEDLRALAVAVGGHSEATIAIQVYSPSTRPTEAPDGEGGLYNGSGWLVYLDADGKVHLGAQTGEAAIPRDDHLQTELARLKSELAAFKSVFDAHIHTTTATVGSTATLGVIAPTTTPFATPADPGDTACDNVRGT